MYLRIIFCSSLPQPSPHIRSIRKTCRVSLLNILRSSAALKGKVHTAYHGIHDLTMEPLLHILPLSASHVMLAQCATALAPMPMCLAVSHLMPLLMLQHPALIMVLVDLASFFLPILDGTIQTTSSTTSFHYPHLARLQ